MRLGIKPDLKSYPVAKSSLQLKLFHSAIGSQVWLPLVHYNAAAFLDTEANVHRFAKRVSRQAKTNRLLMEVYLYTPKPGLYWDTKHHNFTVQKSYGLAALLADVQVLRKEIRAKALKARTLEANRRCTILLLDLQDEDFRQLRASVTLQKELIDVLTNSEQERIYLFLLGAKVGDLPPLILHTMDWVAYLGKDNAAAAQAIFQLEEDIYNEKRQYLGVLKKKGEDKLIPLHDLIFNPSEWKLLKDQFSSVEEEAYKKFLEGLQ